MLRVGKLGNEQPAQVRGCAAYRQGLVRGLTLTSCGRLPPNSGACVPDSEPLIAASTSWLLVNRDIDCSVLQYSRSDNAASSARRTLPCSPAAGKRNSGHYSSARQVREANVHASSAPVAAP